MTWCSHRKGVNEGALPRRPCRLRPEQMCGRCFSSRSPPFTPTPALPFYASGAARGETGKHCPGRVCVCVAGMMSVVSRLCVCLCVCVWGGTIPDQLCHPQLLSQIRALYTHVPPRGLFLLHNTASAAEDASRREPDPPRAPMGWVGGGREVRKCPWLLSLRDVAPNGARRRKKERRISWSGSSLLRLEMHLTKNDCRK